MRRSRAREVALQLLFQRDHNPAVERPALERFARDRLREPALVSFCLALYDGVVANAAAIDERLTQTAENWRLPRMAGVDRNVLRLGASELLFAPDTPPSVAINEAVELARRFGSAESPAFVNGILDRLKGNAAGEVRNVESSEPQLEAPATSEGGPPG
jgi:N utilization substance protein B